MFFYDEVSLVLKYTVFLEKKLYLWKRNAFLLDSALFPNQIVLFWKKTESGNQQKQWKNITFKQAIPIPCEITHFDSKPWVIPTSTGRKQTEGLSCKVHQTCTGTKKNTCFELQSAPNLHRDKKNTSFELQSAPNLHRDKKNTRNKNFTIYVGRVDYPSKVFFCPCAGLVHFEVQNFCFFVPVQVWCTLKFKTQCICSFLFWYCFYCLQIFLTHMNMACFASHAAFWRVRCIFYAKGLQFED